MKVPIIVGNGSYFLGLFFLLVDVMKWLVKNTPVSDLVKREENIVNFNPEEGGGVKIVDDGIKTLVYETTRENERVLIRGSISTDYIEIEGVVNPELEENKYYTFSTPGRHKVRLRITSANSSMFCSCTRLAIIPQNLFSNVETSPQYFNQVFSICSRLLYIPKDLFKTGRSDLYFGTDDNHVEMFTSCSSITYIPRGLFNCNETKYFENMRGCFYNCGKLEHVQEEVFDGLTNAYNFSGIFSYCYSLKFIPENLFKNNIKVTDFGTCFYNCASLKSPVPVDSDGTPIYNRSGEGKEGYAVVTSYGNCFLGCDNIPDYDQIPEDWR